MRKSFRYDKKSRMGYLRIPWDIRKQFKYSLTNKTAQIFFQKFGKSGLNDKAADGVKPRQLFQRLLHSESRRGPFILDRHDNGPTSNLLRPKSSRGGRPRRPQHPGRLAVQEPPRPALLLFDALLRHERNSRLQLAVEVQQVKPAKHRLNRPATNRRLWKKHLEAIRLEILLHGQGHRAGHKQRDEGDLGLPADQKRQQPASLELRHRWGRLFGCARHRDPGQRRPELLGVQLYCQKIIWHSLFDLHGSDGVEPSSR